MFLRFTFIIHKFLRFQIRRNLNLLSKKPQNRKRRKLDIPTYLPFLGTEKTNWKTEEHDAAHLRIFISLERGIYVNEGNYFSLTLPII